MYHKFERLLPTYKYKCKIRQLESEVAGLRRDNEELSRVQDRIKKTDLPFCEDRLCKSCVHAEIDRYVSGLSVQEILVGCRKNRDCKDFFSIKKF